MTRTENAAQIWRELLDAETMIDIVNVVEEFSAADLDADDYSSLAWALEERYGELREVWG